MQTLRCAQAGTRKENIVDLQEYRRSLGLEPVEEPQSVPEEREPGRRIGWGLALDIAASAAILVMTLVFTLRVLIL